MNILILNGSPRHNGNTQLLAQSFAKGAEENGHKIEFISVDDVNINPCKGCNACFKNKDMLCVQHDDMAEIYAKLANADMLVIASPIYFYGISAQLKAIIDRCHNPIRDTFHINKAALLLVGAATLPELFDAILTEYKLCLNYFKIEDMGHVFVRGVAAKGDIKNTDALKQAFDLGKSL